jgi:hypothetical protein
MKPTAAEIESNVAIVEPHITAHGRGRTPANTAIVSNIAVM